MLVLDAKMGGARCSYRNCTKKSDKQTHLFHYPVFDKLRCHQWITNAQKLNYLNLKLSQLKNRMVCEHHFTDDCFMNEMKQKLKNSAIPTLDGPFCTKLDKEEEADLAQIYKDFGMPINIDDIENEFMPKSEKKAHFSVKYGDFLTNDISEGMSLSRICKSPSVIIRDEGVLFNRCDPLLSVYAPASCNSNINLPTRAPQTKSNQNSEPIMVDRKLPDAKVVSIDFDKFNLTTRQTQDKQIESVPSTQPKEKVINKVIPPTRKIRIISKKNITEPVMIPGELIPVSPSIVIQVPEKKKKSNIEIDARQTKTILFNEPQNIVLPKNEQDFNTAAYTDVSRSVIDRNINSYQQPIHEERHNNIGLENIGSLSLIDTKPMDYLPSGLYSTQMEQDTGLSNVNISTGPNIEFVSSSLTGPSVFTLTDLPEVSTAVTETSYVEKPSSQNTSLSTNSEMMNAIQKQAEFIPVTDNSNNARRKNIISNKQIKTVEKLTSKPISPNKATRKIPPEKLAAIEEKRKYNMKLRDILNSCLNNMDNEPDLEKLIAAMKKEISNKKVVDHLYEDNSSKNSKLPDAQENIITYFEARLQRMEENLLNKIEQNSQKILDLKKTFRQPTKKSTYTQTNFSNEALKKSLFQQVSKYLSPDTNNKIYEELFINQCVSKVTTKKDVTKRKRKCTSSDHEL